MHGDCDSCVGASFLRPRSHWAKRIVVAKGSVAVVVWEERADSDSLELKGEETE